MRITRTLEFDIPDEIWDFIIGELGAEETENFIIELASKGVAKGLKFGYEVSMAMKAGIAPETVVAGMLNEFILDGSKVSQGVKDEMILETEKHVYRITEGWRKEGEEVRDEQA